MWKGNQPEIMRILHFCYDVLWRRGSFSECKSKSAQDLDIWRDILRDLQSLSISLSCMETCLDLLHLFTCHISSVKRWVVPNSEVPVDARCGAWGPVHDSGAETQASTSNPLCIHACVLRNLNVPKTMTTT